MVDRVINIQSFLKAGKVLLIYGPRRVGKTTLVKSFLKNTSLRYKLESGDNLRVQDILSSQMFDRILPFAEGLDLLVIDEAQLIPNIGMGLKILVDQIPTLSVIATGSSSFDLLQQTGEPLTGRKRNVFLYPLSMEELLPPGNRYDLQQRLPEFLVYGTYPEVVCAATREEKIETLRTLAESYLFKDVLAIERLRSPKQLRDLLKLLAFQIGNEVSLTELATQIQLNVKTVARYLDLLEKAFVIRRLGGFSRNLRTEVTTKSKYYFYDTGIRNAVIEQFNILENRNDAGALFENFVMMERWKFRSYHSRYGESYFWRPYQGREIDLVEEWDGKLFAYEIKWGAGKKIAAPADWIKAYPEASFSVIDRENYLDFVLPKR